AFIPDLLWPALGANPSAGTTPPPLARTMAWGMLAHGPTHDSVVGILLSRRRAAVALNNVQSRSGTRLPTSGSRHKNPFRHLPVRLRLLNVSLPCHDGRRDGDRPWQERAAKTPSLDCDRRTQQVWLALLVQQERPFRRQLSELCNRQAGTPLIACGR